MKLPDQKPYKKLCRKLSGRLCGKPRMSSSQVEISRPLNKARGFTLVELMVTLAIVAILGAFALPAYNKQVDRGRRAEAKACILDAASRLERFFTQFSSYTTVVEGEEDCAGVTCGLNGTEECPDEGNYTLSVTATGSGSSCNAIPNDEAGPCVQYTITATQVGDRDKDCKSLTLDSQGIKGAIDSQDVDNKDFCWR